MLKEVDKAKIKYYNYDYIEIMGEYLMKKLVCSFMSLAMLVTMFTAMPLTAQAETYDTTIDGITYYVDTESGEAEVADADESITTSNILSEVDGYKVTSIGADAFYYCTSLTTITIPDSVTNIGDCAFYHCTSLTEVVVPDSVTNIGNSAFYGCYSLTDVYYSGSESDWNNISIGYWNGPLTNATIHYGKIDEQPTTPQGDVNGDGKLSILDARLVLVDIANNEQNADTIAIADLNGDGKLTLIDARMLLVKIANGEV